MRGRRGRPAARGGGDRRVHDKGHGLRSHCRVSVASPTRGARGRRQGQRSANPHPQPRRVGDVHWLRYRVTPPAFGYERAERERRALGLWGKRRRQSQGRLSPGSVQRFAARCGGRLPARAPLPGSAACSRRHRGFWARDAARRRGGALRPRHPRVSQDDGARARPAAPQLLVEGKPSSPAPDGASRPRGFGLVVPRGASHRLLPHDARRNPLAGAARVRRGEVNVRDVLCPPRLLCVAAARRAIARDGGIDGRKRVASAPCWNRESRSLASLVVTHSGATPRTTQADERTSSVGSEPRPLVYLWPMPNWSSRSISQRRECSPSSTSSPTTGTERLLSPWMGVG